MNRDTLFQILEHRSKEKYIYINFRKSFKIKLHQLFIDDLHEENKYIIIYNNKLFTCSSPLRPFPILKILNFSKKEECIGL